MDSEKHALPATPRRVWPRAEWKNRAPRSGDFLSPTHPSAKPHFHLKVPLRGRGRSAIENRRSLSMLSRLRDFLNSSNHAKDYGDLPTARCKPLRGSAVLQRYGARRVRKGWISWPTKLAGTESSWTPNSVGTLSRGM